MIRFFWTVFLPMSAVGAAGALLLYGTTPLLYRLGKRRWGVCATLAALCLFLLPLSGLATALPRPAAMPGAGDALLTPPAGASGTAALSGTALAAAGGAANGSMLWPIAQKALPALWVAGAALVLLETALRYGSFLRWLKRESRPVPDADPAWAVRAWGRGPARGVSLRRSAALSSPLCLGVVRPCIYLPEHTDDGPALEYALRHEYAHLRRRHPACKLAAQLMCALHWFNPAVWLLRRMLNEACEFDCDRAVTRALDRTEKTGYCAALLDAAQAGCSTPLASTFARPAGALRRRIETVLAPTAGPVRRAAALALCAALVAGAVCLTACAAGQAVDSVSLAPAAFSQEDTQRSSSVPQAPSDSGVDSGAVPDAPARETPEEKLARLQAELQALGGALESAEQPADGTTPQEPSREELIALYEEALKQWRAAPAGGTSESRAPSEAPAVWPVPDYKEITTQFMGGGVHRGVDIIADQNTDILAMWDGVVLEAEFGFPYGNYVKIDHGDGTTTLYAHCAELLVQAGDSVTAGQKIAAVGSTGASTGYHCHVELEQDGQLVDPLSLFPDTQ